MSGARSWARWAVAACVALALLAWTLLQSAGGPEPLPPGVLELRQAAFVASDAAAPPPPGAAWSPQPLPDSWRESRPGVHGRGWYRFELDMPEAPRELQALYIPLVSSAYQVIVNGVLVADSGGVEGPDVGRSAGFPQWAAVPPQALRAGRNDLYLRLRVAPNLRGGLSAAFFGPQRDLRRLFDTDSLWRVAVPRTLNTAVLALGLLVLLLWSRHRDEAVYGWCGAFLVVSALWSLRNFDDVLVLASVSPRAWETFVLSGLAIARLMLLLFVLRLRGLRWPRVERAAVLAMPLLPLALHAAGESAMSAVRTPFYLACGVPMWISIGLLAQPSARRGGGSLLVLAAVAGSEALAVHDWLVAVNWLPFGTQRWQDYASALLTVGLVGALAGRYFAAFATARMRNRELEDRVRQKTEALEATLRQVAAFELDSALNEERQRLMRDMHDGIGSQLITMTGAVERGTLEPGQLARQLRECIDDLRLVIDSLEPDQGNLAAALANLRHRFAPRLEAAGLAMRWDLDGLPAALALSPGAVLQVLRVVQEAITNTLRHAGARQAWLEVKEEPAGLLVRVSDDGSRAPTGSPPGASQGRGLANMRQRARLLGGSLEIRFGHGGTEVLLHVPLCR